ncbi:VWA domain-containing protein [Aporhodopirellula aestuarii]|uniref:VWA domain-containing protein n=1 Tax=Aporhodopirellula aestuarii TaxID=2950107 RepID=A0ABT0TXN6_9BACT|nr:VWA domain-containing protein [Aporhodopirellula aestuarii]MCM2369335.1 VWA domain-containing protein [Aporhodopirellula aestuarii]
MIVYEFARAASIDGWWIWAALLAAIIAALAVCVIYYRRDASELPRPVRWTLIALRLTAILAIVFLFFDLVRRTERRITRASEVVVLVDTSQSMSLPSSGAMDSPSRTQLALNLLEQSEMLDKFDDEHRTSVYAIGGPELIATSAPDDASDGETESDSSPTSGMTNDIAKEPTSPFALFGVFCLAVFAIASVLSLVLGATASLRPAKSPAAVNSKSNATTGRGETIGWTLLVAAITMVSGIISLGAVYMVHTDQSLLSIVGLTDSADSGETDSTNDTEAESDDVTAPEPVSIDWETMLAASQAQSPIGDALRSILVDHDSTTLAGVVLITDGQNNGGTPLSSALAMARRDEVSLYPVGLGSSQPPTNVRVVDLEAPRRVYPGDKFVVAAVLQATGESAMEVDVELIDALDNANEDGPAVEDEGDQNRLPGGQVLESQRVRLEPDATLTGIRFEIEPQTVGRRRLGVRIVAPPEDRNRVDDMQTARYEVVARKLKVLAIAGGPTREYRFVRNLLYRDDSVQLDVWLQTGRTGISQDADELLTTFPQTAEELFEYDAILMFDPDWAAIDSASLDLIDRFLTQQAGGLVLVAGPVYHPKITTKRGDTRTSQINGFFPVNLATRGPLLGGGRQGGRNAWPLEFTPEAAGAEFLWVADTPEQSFEIWQEVGNVYDYVGVKSAKPGAKVYAYFSDPTTEVSGSLPIFLASQFYGAGRVYFQGSGEMWRLRAAGDQYFDNYYTKLVRWVSEGRLLRDSNRGMLLVDAARAMVGQTVTLRAVLVDDQFQPLNEPFVTAKLLSPDGRIKDLRLSPAADSPRGGTYTGNFVATKSGSYEIQLTIGDALDEQILRQTVQVRLPTSELERPRRADDELMQLATTTRGKYLPVDNAGSITSVAETLTKTIQPQPQVTVLAGTPDRPFGERRNAVLMWLIASVLTFEWVTRRLHRLA